ncbi:hypothetical protein SAMN04515647_3059 [Cohaesibacter sp. ES.047]|uniref:hypothetical protein n=1 Tax=Cohaesibacter sp. ES.047 TaxID=1798205 RepID=UPI000BB9AA23|nr:hypothetical protein [Cohaesibacter sp. ES.047]SNY92791.1 hypothetical protein SAMN04515647_3059 [Cohaesibacter sp. ES.047]
MKKDKPLGTDWEAIRCQCNQADRPSFAAIARQHGISITKLRHMRKRWTEADETTTNGDKPKTDEDPAQTSGSSEHQSLVQRLYQATDRQIRHLEGQFVSGEAAFDEKEARMLGTIARTLEKILALQPREDKGTNGKSKTTAKTEPADGAASDATDLDALRQDLAQRIDRLQQATKNTIAVES